MRIKRVKIETSQIETLHHFYSSVLGLEVESNSRSTFSLRIGESQLEFEEKESGEPFYHFAFNIPANKIEEARDWVLQKGIELLWMEDYNSDIADFRNWHAKSVYFFDPAGNILELIARFDLQNESNEEFGADQFLSISEIGLVFPENSINHEVERIVKQYEIPYFLKQPPMNQFKVLGDDEGLLIIVTEKRNWYPTNRQSGIYPLEITLENNGKTEILRL